MHFFVPKRRGAPAVIIVALIDVLIVLLIFLMVTTTFKLQPALKLALPESTQGQTSGASENQSLLISIDQDGNLRLGEQAVPISVESLRNELLAQAEKNPALRVALSADKQAPFGQIVRVMDVAKEAKIKMISAFTKEPPKQ